MADELPDTAEGMEARETARELPVGWLVLFFGLIAWGLAYLWAYSPWGRGWSQEAEYHAAQGGGGPALDVANTILFTAIPAVVLVVLAVAMARRKPRR